MKLRLKIIRKVNNYTQSDIASILGVTQRTYSKYETGELSLKIEQLVELSNFYKLTTDYILGIVSDSPKLESIRKFDYDKFINYLRYLRFEHNYSQRQLANLVNCSPSLISMIELKRSGVQLDMLISLANVYGKTVDDVLFSE